MKVLRGVGLTILLSASAGCGKERPRSLRDFNVVLINIDTLRADHLGCYGYSRQTSPFIDRLASEGVLFEKARSNSSFTRESVAALFQGLLPSRTGAIGWDAHPTSQTLTMARILSDAGYATGFFSDSIMLTDATFTDGFDQVQHAELNASGTGRRLTEAAGEYLRNIGNGKFFLYLHYFDPHAPYEPAPELYRRFESPIYDQPISLYDDLRNRCAELIQEGFGQGDERFEDLVVRYDAEILDTDRAIRMLYAQLEKLDKTENTLIIVTADHGEEFLEHGFVDHAWTLFEESVRIPLIFWAGGQFTPSRVVEPVSSVDILPTVIRLLGLEAPEGVAFDGESLFTSDPEEFAIKGPTRPYVGEILIQHRNVLHAVVADDWKYISAQKWLTLPRRSEVSANQNELIRAYRTGKRELIDPWGPPQWEGLYNLSADPGEERNLIAEFPAQRDRLASVLRDLRILGSLGSAAIGNGPNLENMSPERIKRLKALGYL